MDLLCNIDRVRTRKSSRSFQLVELAADVPFREPFGAGRDDGIIGVARRLDADFGLLPVEQQPKPLTATVSDLDSYHRPALGHQLRGKRAAHREQHGRSIEVLRRQLEPARSPRRRARRTRGAGPRRPRSAHRRSHDLPGSVCARSRRSARASAGLMRRFPVATANMQIICSHNGILQSDLGLYKQQPPPAGCRFSVSLASNSRAELRSFNRSHHDLTPICLASRCISYRGSRMPSLREVGEQLLHKVWLIDRG